MPRLYHPVLDRYHDVPSERTAAIYKRSGWVNAQEADEARFFLASAGFDPQEVHTTDVGGDAPESETPDNEEE